MKKMIIAACVLFVPAFAFAGITKTVEVDRINVQKNGVLNVYTVTTILEDGEEISRQEKMTQYTPGQDVSEEDAKIQSMAATVWTEDVIAQYESDQTGEPLTLDQQKAIKTKALYVNVKQFINTLPGGMPRYDADMKDNLNYAMISALKNGSDVPAAVQSAENWILTVQNAFLAMEASIAGAQTVDDLNAIDVSLDTFEAKYGRSGTVAPDPGVTTADLYNP